MTSPPAKAGIPTGLIGAQTNTIGTTYAQNGSAVPTRSRREKIVELAQNGRSLKELAEEFELTLATTHHEVDPRPLFQTVESIFDVARMNRAALRKALGAPREADFEDVYLAAAGREAGTEIVVTRNEEDFAGGPLTPYHPETLRLMIGN